MRAALPALVVFSLTVCSEPAAGPLKICFLKTHTPAPAAAARTTRPRITGTSFERAAARLGALSDAASVGRGRGLATCEAERMNFDSPEAGACGTTIF